MTRRRLLLVASVALVINVVPVAGVGPRSAEAAVDASITSTHGRVGNYVRLTIPPADSGLRAAAPNGRLPLYFISTDAFARMLAKYGGINCSADGQVLLGYVSWSGDIGTLTFAIPNVPPGTYYFEVEVSGTSPSCWRVGETGPVPAGAGPLEFIVGDQPAEPLPPTSAPTTRMAVSGSPSSGANWLVLVTIVIVAAGAAATVIAVATRRRQP